MKDSFKFALSIEKKKFEKFSTVSQVRVESRFNFLTILPVETESRALNKGKNF